MLKHIKTFFSNSKRSLFTFNNEPFSKFSILFIVLLDIFLLVTILTGIDSEKRMSPNVHTKYPSECQNQFNPEHKKKIWDNTTKRYLYENDKFPFKNYNSFHPSYSNGYYSSKRIQVKDNQRVADICRELDHKISTFANTQKFKNNKKLLKKLKNDKRNTYADINSIESRYNTSLFEKTASVSGVDLKKTKKKYHGLLIKEKLIDAQIGDIPKVNTYAGYREYVEFVNSNRKAFKKEIDSYRFWQPFIEFLYLLKFALPLMLLSFIGYKYANKINREMTVPIKLLKLVTGHIVFIVSIPMFFNAMYLIYHVIPHRFMKTVVEFLYKFNFIFVGYYFLMFLGIAFFGFIIFLIQKNVSKREEKRKTLKERYLHISSFNENKCPNCKNRVDYFAQKYCGFCGEKVNRTCKECKEDTPTHIVHCMQCGNKEDEQKQKSQAKK